MFLGEHQHTLDAKGRVSLPRRFRGESGEHLVVSKGLENCLYVMPGDTFQEFLDTLLAGNDLTATQRTVRRFFFAGASEVDVDKAGRISIPPALREHAGLVKDVAVIGNGDRIEIWDSAAWEAYTTSAASDIETTAEELAARGVL